MATKTPTDRAIADVEKAIKAHDKAHEKYEAAASKADEAMEEAKRADRELRWRTNHPDLPEDFDLDEFRRSLEAPFDDVEEKANAIGDAIESGAVDPDALEEPVSTDDLPQSPVDDIVEGDGVRAEPGNRSEIDEAAPEDDPWAGED